MSGQPRARARQAGVDRVLVGPGREHEQRRLGDDRGRELAKPRGLLAARVMQVLDHEQERRLAAGRLDQLAHDLHAPVLDRLGVEIALDGRLVRRERRADQSAGVQDALGRQAPGRDRGADRLAALGRARVGPDAEQAREQRRQRAARFHLAEVENLHAMGGDALAARDAGERLEQPRLADAGFAARDDRAAASRRDAALEQRGHQRELRVPAGEQHLARADRAAQVIGQQDFVRRSAPCERVGIANRVAGERKRAVDARRQERALRDADGRRAGHEVGGGKRLLKRLRGAERPLRLVAGEVFEAEHCVQGLPRKPVRAAAVQRDGFVEELLQALRELAGLLRIERATPAT